MIAFANIRDGYSGRMRAALVPIGDIVRAADWQVFHGAGDWLGKISIRIEIIPFLDAGAVCQCAEADLAIRLVGD